MNTKVRSAHFIFDESVGYADLVKVYPELFRKFLEITNQMPEDENMVQIWIDRDLHDLKRGKKPEGFLKQNAIKLVFPMREGYVEFYIYMKVKNEEIPVIAAKLERILKKHGLNYTVKYDIMRRFENVK